MRVIMKSFHTLPDGPALQPGDHHEFEEAEARRLVAVGGARHITPEDEGRLDALDREKAKAAFRLQLDGMTVDELKAGAAQRGIELQGATKKADIVAAIIAAAEKAEQEAGAAGGQK
ncbi:MULTISPECIES: hypothetical protein [unclassified Bradyrhizobium]|uniref:hypothetical protein n=1 Tax=unclassified Bradyrhizobium TaxID=2631580 RepID=UPI001BA90B41|nr:MULTISPECIES: hypothetical protein [unclassified Bradyrhizobium]WLA52367.1 hypothetical protein QIH80_21105 [Bradyrhizobium elkanii]MBR1206967.1 hypothetical protein [Bradyrhizobium sp. AUGA SZCCT0124]MBR1313506.1 hypothetical protein [Bradyrhizobium sp. AUGA SZCCT0051]MBR1343397.1 hypothetical protein [Bradyrhizobium sp. AUGA SZCCT0105]MBR1357183.1 hypothetical protein [Bradyrhizobium sp. AUGA SZCCT0045]